MPGLSALSAEYPSDSVDQLHTTADAAQRVHILLKQLALLPHHQLVSLLVHN